MPNGFAQVGPEAARTVEVIPARRHLRPSDTLYKKIIKFSIMDCSTYNARIDLAVADLHQQEKPNFKATARKHVVNNTTLKRRYQGRQLSKQAASSEYRQCLTFAQEETLIDLINSLTDRGIPPTSQIVRNLAQEMIGRPVGKNWTGDFVKRYKNRLRSLYLRNIDSQRMKAEYAPLFKQFYDLVTLLKRWLIRLLIFNTANRRCREI